ncbi:helix-turn-helix transcriptional regulator [Leptothoe sp. PORK10 BA2]|uniref:helix-turn-helix transcriptional regulator n=1 Tax=Leptothoe sp. PORK10 BA2 TaxID=3110254 RepID=UPI002B1F49DE|nr:AraC family transcriptional regulator [Leptothoe sp. PORK10 BA2]
MALSQTDYRTWMDEAAASSGTGDSTEWRYCYPSALGWGQECSVALREGLELLISDVCLNEDLEVDQGERPHPLEYTFELLHRRDQCQQRYSLYGSGLAPTDLWVVPGHQRMVSVNVHIDPEPFQQWLGDASQDARILDLLRSPEQPYLERSGTPTAAMQMAVQQILRCPFQGLTRRLYLESKVWELMALLIDDLNTSGNDAKTPTLKPDDVERIHYASKILRRQITHPPTLIELARAVGINDHKLKVGFRQVFGTTVFGYLHEHRMERSHQLLEAGELSVTAAAEAVGFTSRGHFAAAFRRKYGVNPGVYARGRRA